MLDNYGLIANNLIPLSKYWSTRLGFLDLLHDTNLFLPQIEKRNDIGDDLKVLIRISKEWKTKQEHNVGEAGAVFRLLQFTSWKYNLNKTFIKEGTLKTRPVCSNPKIVSWPIKELVKLDNNTPQWASAAILIGNTEEIPNDFFLKLSKEALAHYNHAKNNGISCELRYDETILAQAEAFLDILNNRQTNFKPQQQDDYCFARAFGLIAKEQGENTWPELKSHESNRLEEMEKQLNNLKENKQIDSNDHRVVQSIAMLAFTKNKKVRFTNPNCVTKSWPQFWKFMDYVKKI